MFFGARPHPYSIHLFIGCIRGDGMVLTCRSEEYFNTNEMECALIPTTPSPCIVPDNICVGLQLELIAHPCFCFRFIVCYIGANIIDNECPPDTIFDPISKE